MTEGDDPWTSFQVSLLMAATMLAIVCSICLILTALRPYITTTEFAHADARPCAAHGSGELKLAAI